MTHKTNRLLYTRGQGFFEESQWMEPTLTDSKNIIVQSQLTGICRSDVDMMNGKFGPLPMSMQGHEGLGIVLQTGADVTDVKVGDFVATRGEPAYADRYECAYQQYVRVPAVDPKYILEPVACALNVYDQAASLILDKFRSAKNKNAEARVAMLGTGFLAQVIAQIVPFRMDVFGSNNSGFESHLVRPIEQLTEQYDIVIDLSKHNVVFEKSILKPQALVIMATEKPVQTNFANILWNAVTMVFPSPRSAGFYECMKQSLQLIENGRITVDNLWKTGYNRTNWKEAFENANLSGKRTYLDWRNNQ